MAKEKAPEIRKDIPAKKPEQHKTTPSFLDEKISQAKDVLAQNAKTLRAQVDKAGQTLIDAVPESIKTQVKLINAIEKDLNRDIYLNAELMPEGKTAKDLERLAKNYLKNLRDNVAKLKKLNPDFDTTKYKLKILKQEKYLFTNIASSFGEEGEQIARANGVNIDAIKSQRKISMALNTTRYHKLQLSTESQTDEYGSIFYKNGMSDLEHDVSTALGDINDVKSNIDKAKKRGENVTEEEKRLKEDADKIYEAAQKRLLQLQLDAMNKLDVVLSRGLDEDNIEEANGIFNNLKTFEKNAEKILRLLKKAKVNTSKTEEELKTRRKSNKAKEAFVMIRELEIHEKNEKDEDKDQDINVSSNYYDAHPEEEPRKMPDEKGIDMMTKLINTLNEAVDKKDKKRSIEIEGVKIRLKEQILDFIERFQANNVEWIEGEELEKMGDSALKLLDFFKLLGKNKYITNNEEQRLEGKIKGIFDKLITKKIANIDEIIINQLPPQTVRDMIGEMTRPIEYARSMGMNVKKYIEELNLLEAKNNKRDGHPNFPMK